MLIYQDKKEHKFYSVVLKDFELHGKSYKAGTFVPYDEISYLIENMQAVGIISPPRLETK